MECRIQSMTESNPETPIPQGKVEAVCREWLVREDGVLAYKLQNEEIQHHYGHNKERNQLVRTDLQEAKVIQRSEEEEAEMMQRAYEQMLLEQENADAAVAKQIQDRLIQEELEKQRRIEEEDKRIALELQKKEKLRLQRKREERELRQIEKVKAVQSAPNSTEQLNANGFSSSVAKEASTSQLEEDFSDLCLQPPSDLSEEERKRFREEQDAELAKFLQDQELKRRNQNAEDQQLAIEAQDRELARILQEQERARARRAKERAKQKAMLQSQQQQQQEQEHGARAGGLHYAVSPIEDIETSQMEVKMKDNVCYGIAGVPVPDLPDHSVNNIAMVLDPTYNKQRVPATSLPSSLTNSPLSPPACSANDPLLYPSGSLNDNFYLHADDEEVVAPPYMPIQGQRRPQTLEKAKKLRKQKDGCKTQ